MNDRDTFAAAALTGLLARVGDDLVPPDRLTKNAFAWADAMLAARGTTAHDAAPAATASTAENQAVGRRAETSAGEAGTGDTRARQEPVAWVAYESESDAEPIVLCFKESRARAHVRGVAGSRVVPLYATPPAPGVTLTDDAVPLDSDILDAVVKVVYEAMLFDRGRLHCRPAPPWVRGGNSLAQDEARDAAREILAMVPPAASVTLTDAEREVLREYADIVRSQLRSAEDGGDEETIARWTLRHAIIRGLLARACGPDCTTKASQNDAGAIRLGDA